MVMASAGVNVPGGDGNPAAAAASSAATECHLRRRRRLAPPPPAAAAAAGSGGDGAGPSDEKRSRPASPARSYTPTSSSDDGSMYTVDEEETEDELEEGELPPPAVGLLALPAPPQAPPPPAPVLPVKYGSVALAGRMREMEDTVSLHPAFFTWVDGTPMHLFAVFDGHGGPHVSALCRNQMHLILADDLAREAAHFLQRRHQQQQQWVEEAEEERSWGAALKQAFARVDALSALACACGVATVPSCTCPMSGIKSAIVGSTAVVALLVGRRVVVANCGDSRAVLCRGPAGTPPVPLTFDHKPDRPDERARIERAGGHVMYLNGPRVRGILAMSRALGDGFLRPEVISEPEITITRRTEADQCLIIATDGMWDAIDNETACSVARQSLEELPFPNNAAAPPAGGVGPPEHDQRSEVTAAILARLALGRGSPDNISVVIVDLQRRAAPAG